MNHAHSQTANQLGIGAAFDLVASALGVIYENRDLVTWLSCVLNEWKSLDPAYDADNVSSTLACMTLGSIGHFGVYLVSRFLEFERGPFPLGLSNTTPNQFLDTFGATGGATEGYPSRLKQGAVLPVNHGNLVQLARIHARRAPGANAPDGVKQLAVSTVVAEIILHEWMHLCSSAERDSFQCFAIQNMVATSFGWAMGQRYPELQTLMGANGPCLSDVADQNFMSSEPDTVGPPSRWTYLTGDPACR